MGSKIWKMVLIEYCGYQKAVGQPSEMTGDGDRLPGATCSLSSRDQAVHESLITEDK